MQYPPCQHSLVLTNWLMRTIATLSLFVKSLKVSSTCFTVVSACTHVHACSGMTTCTVKILRTVALSMDECGHSCHGITVLPLTVIDDQKVGVFPQVHIANAC